jgi:N-acetylmuramoyl-L-alanine amidase
MNTGNDQPEQIPRNAPFPEALRYLGITLTVSAILATLFTAWTPESLNPADLVGDVFGSVFGSEELEPAETASVGEMDEERVIRVGVVAGHMGPHPETGLVDPGAICEDGLTELEVNQAIAEYVIRGLQAVGIEVDYLEEFDTRLTGYEADALVSIHADACYYINEEATGYKVSRSAASDIPQTSDRLVNCIVDRYGRATGLDFHPGSITLDMTEYHTFYEIHSNTPAAIIETGFLYLDREFLTSQPEKAARGIVEGILCYVNKEPINLFESQP